MSYCSVCGISYQIGDLVCTGCGNKLAPESERELENRRESGDAALFNRALMNDFNGFEMGTEQDPESQLGKGLIKPHSIELENDGFHFKYDKPARNFIKTKNTKEKMVEYRLTCPEPGSETSWEGSPPGEIPTEETPSKETSLEELPSEKTSQAVSDNQQSVEIEEMVELEAAEANLTGEPAEIGDVDPSIESADQPADEEVWVAGEIFPGTATGSPVEPESVPGFESPEPELETDEDMVLWEDSRRWLGIPLANQYRISNRSLQIIDRLACKFSEVDLALISEVTLRQSWFDKLFKTGDLSVSVKHLPETGLKLMGVRNPEKVRRLLEELIKQSLELRA